MTRGPTQQTGDHNNAPHPDPPPRDPGYSVTRPMTAPTCGPRRTDWHALVDPTGTSAVDDARRLAPCTPGYPTLPRPACTSPPGDGRRDGAVPDIGDELEQLTTRTPGCADCSNDRSRGIPGLVATPGSLVRQGPGPVDAQSSPVRRSSSMPRSSAGAPRRLRRPLESTRRGTSGWMPAVEGRWKKALRLPVATSPDPRCPGCPPDGRRPRRPLPDAAGRSGPATRRRLRRPGGDARRTRLPQGGGRCAPPRWRCPAPGSVPRVDLLHRPPFPRPWLASSARPWSEGDRPPRADGPAVPTVSSVPGRASGSGPGNLIAAPLHGGRSRQVGTTVFPRRGDLRPFAGPVGLPVDR